MPPAPLPPSSATPPAAATTPRIFLSYSRADAAYAAKERARFEAQGLALWQDISHMESGKWWEQICDALEAPATEHMLLFVSRHSLGSDVVFDEWRYARRKGVMAHLIKVPGGLAPCVRDEHFIDLEQPDQFNRLVELLKGPSRQLAQPPAPGGPDEHFVIRREESQKLLTALTTPPAPQSAEQPDQTRTVGITAALRGAGGYGKTQLARWLVQQDEIINHFCDGVLWLELGAKPTDGELQGKIAKLIRDLRGKKLTDEDRIFNSPREAAERLMALLERGTSRRQDKAGRYLLVIDEAWRKSDVDLFTKGAPHSVRLITTRLDDTVPLHADKIPVDAMKPAEAVELLSVGMGALGVSKEDIKAHEPQLKSLAARLGEWALLLALVAGQLRNEQEAGDRQANAIGFVNRLYDEEGLTAFDPENEDDRSRLPACPSASDCAISMRTNRLASMSWPSSSKTKTCRSKPLPACGARPGA